MVNQLRQGVALLAFALCTRMLAAWALGNGAPFGPDGTGAEAAVTLGGHLYPAHIEAIRLMGDARSVSIAAGALGCLFIWLIGRRMGLGGTGGWLAATLPVGVYTGALSAGDAPALMVVLGGIALTTFGRGWALLGGALAMTCVTVKPIALPALGLLLLNPLSILGAGCALPFVLPWLSALTDPMPHGGVLGTWWIASDGAPPADWLTWLSNGLHTAVFAPVWIGTWLAAFAAAGAIWPQRRLSEKSLPEPKTWTRWAVIGPVLTLVATACLLGDTVPPRYFGAAVVALLPWVGAISTPWFCVALAWPAAAVITQLGTVRADLDPSAAPPNLPVVPFNVDAKALFASCSTPGATDLRAQAEALAQTLPQGATHRVVRRDHGREGELVWPLRVLRPDVQIEIVEP